MSASRCWSCREDCDPEYLDTQELLAHQVVSPPYFGPQAVDTVIVVPSLSARYTYGYLCIRARARMLVRNPIMVLANGYQQGTPPDEIHMAGWRADRREISEGGDYFPANVTAKATPRYVTCHQNTRLFLYASKHT